MKFDEKDFDTMLESAMSELPPDDIVEEVTPWRKSMRRVIIGLGLTSLTLNFWCLNYILPVIGMVFLFLGYRTLRRANGWFMGCYVLTLLRLVTWFPSLIWDATIYNRILTESSSSVFLIAISLILRFIGHICLWQGIKAVQRKAGLEEHAGGAVGLIVWFLVLTVLAMIGYSGIIIGLGVIVAYICILRSLWTLARDMDEAGYMIDASPVHLPDWCVTLIIGGILAIGLTLAYTFGGSYDMDWQPMEVSGDEEAAEVRAHLAELGFPEEILRDMTDADVLECKGAIRVVTEVRNHALNDGRRVQEKKKNADGYYSFHTYTVYDVKELQITGVAVELPTEREHWKIIHHFRWTSHPGYFGTECIQLWPAYHLSKGWGQASDFTGQVLYDKDGVTYTSPYISLGEETFTSTSMFWGQSTSTDVFAEFSMPDDGEAQRGYVSYTIKEMQDGWLVDAWINYTHGLSWRQYPFRTAKQQRMMTSQNRVGAFMTVQDALQFNAAEEKTQVIGGSEE
ncbi:MAG: hypothetical protein E7658_01170 [Ruminococcaceae bacterium]|nr:hypothetical protein [Oscillospiraceae bacterium]